MLTSQGIQPYERGFKPKVRSTEDLQTLRRGLRPPAETKPQSTPWARGTSTYRAQGLPYSFRIGRSPGPRSSSSVRPISSKVVEMGLEYKLAHPLTKIRSHALFYFTIAKLNCIFQLQHPITSLVNLEPPRRSSIKTSNQSKHSPKSALASLRPQPHKHSLACDCPFQLDRITPSNPVSIWAFFPPRWGFQPKSPSRSSLGFSWPSLPCWPCSKPQFMLHEPAEVSSKNLHTTLSARN